MAAGPEASEVETPSAGTGPTGRFRASPRPITHAGSITSQGDIALRADVARTTYGVDGSGVGVGVISDAFDTLFGAAADIASGDLPTSGVTVLNGESPLCGVLVFCIDEGRAMLQIIHDMAPGADLYFHTGIDGIASYANAIDALAAAGADVIVDDLLIINEPMFQDGIVAQAVDAAVAAGVVYFSAAGNSGRNGYESAFDDSGEIFCIEFFEPEGDCDPIFERVGTMHDFDPGPGVDNYLNITIPENAVMTIAMQWDQPFGGTGPVTDHDIVLLESTGAGYHTISANDNVTMGESWEALQYDNSEFLGNGTEFSVILTYDDVDSVGPPATLVKLVIFGEGITINEYQTNSSTSYGHANAASAESVGAAFFLDTPEFGTSPPQLQPYSSAGGTPILFDTDGVALGSPEIRQKPNITAADGVNTTFFFDDRHGNDGIDDFFGTSAAAPHAAGIAALLLDARPGTSPQMVNAALEDTAIDMGVAGVDLDSGHGLVQTDAAINELLTQYPAPFVGMVPLPDVNSDGLADLALLAPVTTTSHAYVKAAPGGGPVSDIDFGPDPVIAVELIDDLDGNGVPEIAVLGTRPSGQVRVQLKDSVTGETVNTVFFGSAYSAIDMAVVPDTNANGAPELAVLGRSASGGVRVQVRDALSDAETSTTFWGDNVAPLDVLVIPDVSGNGQPEVVMHGRITGSGQSRAQVRDTATGALLRNIFFGATYEPLQLVVIGDVSGDGIDDLAQLARRPDTGAIRVQVKESSGGTIVANAFLGSTDAPVGLAGIGDANANTWPDVAVLVERPDGSGKVVIRDGATGDFIRNTFMGAIEAPVGLAVIGDIDASGNAELAALGENAGVMRVQIRDSVSGVQINNVDFP